MATVVSENARPVPAASVTRWETGRTAAWALLVVGFVAWLVGLSSAAEVGPWGLLPRTSAFSYVAFLAVAAVCVYGVLRRGPLSDVLLPAALVSLVLVLYGTPSFLQVGAGAYRNGDVTRSILERGTLGSSAGLAQHWPGGFAFSALLAQLGGFASPTSHAVWVQLVSALALALLVFALARSVSTSIRAAWAAVLVFAVGNWAAQLSYGPEPLVLALYLGLLLLVLRFYRRVPNRLGRRTEGLLGERALGKDYPVARPVLPEARTLALVCVLLVQAALTATHPSAPFITILAVLVLRLLGYVRSWTLVVGMLVVTAVYLIGSFRFLGVHDDRFDGARSGGAVALVLVLALALLSVLAVVARWRRGRRPALTMAVLIISPVLLALVQQQGAGARYQALSFALPWCAVAVGWLLAQLGERAPAGRTGQVAAMTSAGASAAGSPSVGWSPSTATARPGGSVAASASVNETETDQAGPPRRWEAKAPLVLTLALVVGVLLSLVSLHWAASSLGDYGLPPALPFVWYLGLLVLVLSAVAALALGRVRPWLSGAHLIGLVVVLYGSGAILAGPPRFAWTYKHVGVTRYITAYGKVDPNIDIYHRWPGFFSLASMFGSVAGRPDPVSYAAWAGPFFVVVQSLLVVAIAKTMLSSTRAAWAAGLLFATINWVGQDYFSPQTFAFTLALGVFWLAMLHYKSSPTGRLGRLGTWVLAKVGRTDQHRDQVLTPEPLWGPRTALAVILVVYAAIVPTHQLTPYIIVLVLGVLAVAGAIRPRWVPLVLLVLALAFLVPNFNYVQQHYNVFSGLDPFSNAEPVNSLDHATAGKVLNVDAGYLITLVFALLALVSLVIAWRRGKVGVFHAALAFAAPLLILLGQSYGGEGSLRVILFAAPWAAVLIAAAFAMRAGRRILVLVPVLVVFLALFMPAYYGVEEINRMPRSEVVASDFLYANGQAGSIVVLSAANFPLRLGERYPLFRGPRNDADPVLTRGPALRNRPLGAADVPTVVKAIERYGPKGYVVFSDSQEEYAKVFGVTDPSNLRSLEAAMLQSGRFRVFYENDTTRIYELVS